MEISGESEQYISWGSNKIFFKNLKLFLPFKNTLFLEIYVLSLSRHRQHIYASPVPSPLNNAVQIEEQKAQTCCLYNSRIKVSYIKKDQFSTNMYNVYMGKKGTKEPKRTFINKTA